MRMAAPHLIASSSSRRSSPNGCGPRRNGPLRGRVTEPEPSMRERLSRPSLKIAPLLLGAVVTSTVGGDEVAIRLTEVEAYEGLDDPASHAYRGPTRRTAVMFGPAGHLYCYFTYGMHWCANVVCDVDGRASAVLLRAGEVVR